MSNDRPPEEKAAQQALDEAVSGFMSAIGWNEGVLTGWVLVAHHASFDEDGLGVDSYPIIYMGSSLPDHVAEGLLRRGLKILNDGLMTRLDE